MIVYTLLLEYKPLNDNIATNFTHENLAAKYYPRLDFNVESKPQIKEIDSVSLESKNNKEIDTKSLESTLESTPLESNAIKETDSIESHLGNNAIKETYSVSLESNTTKPLGNSKKLDKAEILNNKRIAIKEYNKAKKQEKNFKNILDNFKDTETQIIDTHILKSKDSIISKINRKNGVLSEINDFLRGAVIVNDLRK